MDTLIKDLTHTFRVLRQSPGFTLTAIAALTLGIGANTAIFSVVNAVLLKPLPYPDSARIVLLMNKSPQGSFPAGSVPKYNSWRAQTGVLDDVAAFDQGGPGINVGGGDRPEQAKGIHVSHEFFRLFGATIAIGRSFTAEEDRPEGGSVVVLSDGLWKRRFGGDTGVIGKPLILGGQPYTIIGVVSPSFVYDPAPDLYLPFQADPNSTAQAHYFRVAARLKPGVSIDAANAALDLAAQEFRGKFPNALGPNNTFAVAPMQETVVRNVRTALLILLGAVGFVLLIACANVANLLLVRATARSREFALRTALGASRGRVIRQLLTESVVLSLAGGVFGLGLAVVGVRSLLALNPGNLPRSGASGVTVDWVAMAFTFGLSVLTGVLFGLIPALQVSRVDLNSVLKESSARSGPSAGQNKARSVLVVVEIALAIVLLIGAGLLIRTFSALRAVAPGFDPHHVLTMDTSLLGDRYDKTAAISDLARQALEKIEALPGVEAAAASCYLPLEGGLGLPFAIAGRPLTNGPAHGGAGWAYVTPRFFDVFKVRIVRGRAFSIRDDAGSPGVAIINEAFAKQYWPNSTPIGERITIGPGMGPAFAEGPREIVGIAADARDGGLNSNPQPQMFVPVAQVRDSVMALNNKFMPLSWVVRTAGNPFAISQQVQRIFEDQAGLPVAHIRSMDQVVVQSTARDQFNTLLLSIFAFTAILLASIGLYGLLAYSVEQRTLEFGVRLALGADSGAVRNMIVRQAMVLAAIGIALGLAAAFGLTRLMASLLFGVKPTDPLIFGSVALLIGAVSFLASYLPARRAVRIEPVVALRYQ